MREYSSRDSSTPIGAIVGGVVGGIIGILVILLVIFLLLRRRRQHQERERAHAFEEKLENNAECGSSSGGGSAPSDMPLVIGLAPNRRRSGSGENEDNDGGRWDGQAVDMAPPGYDQVLRAHTNVPVPPIIPDTSGQAQHSDGMESRRNLATPASIEAQKSPEISAIAHSPPVALPDSPKAQRHEKGLMQGLLRGMRPLPTTPQ